MHSTKSGLCQLVARDDYDCIAQIKCLLSFFPDNCTQMPPVYQCGDDVNRRIEELNDIIPDNKRRSYDMKSIITKIADDNFFFEISPMYARNIIIGFVRMGGMPVGVVANQTGCMAGCLDIDASDKASRHIRICDSFNIPIVTFEDVPGYLPGLNQEMGGIIRHGAKLLYAYSEATAPKITIVMRKAYGGSYLGMCSKDLGADVVLAWPQAQIAVMGAEGAANIIFRKEIEAAEDKAAKRAEKIEEYKESFANPYRAAQRGFVDRVILPEETRPALYQALVMTESKSELRPKRKHGIMPN